MPPPAGGSARRDRINQAVALKKGRELGEAMKLLEGLVAEEPNDLYASGHLAHTLLLRGQARESIELCTQILARDPENGFVHFVRAEALYRLRRHADAALDYEAAAASTFRSAHIWGRLADARARSGDADGARRALDRGLAEFPGDGRLLASLARHEKALGHTAEASRHMEAAAKALPGDPYVYAGMVAARARMRRDAGGTAGTGDTATTGSTGISRSDPSDPAAELKRLLKIPSQARNPHLHDELARLLAEQKDPEGAILAAKKAHELDPRSRLFHNRYAFALVRARHDAEAMTALQACIDHEPEDALLNRSYVAAARRLGRLDEAHAFYVALLRRHPEAKKVFGWMRRVAREAGEAAAGEAAAGEDAGGHGPQGR